MLRQDVPDPEAGFEGHAMNIKATARPAPPTYWANSNGARGLADESRGQRIRLMAAWVLSREQNNEEIIWSRGVQLSRHRGPETPLNCRRRPSPAHGDGQGGQSVRSAAAPWCQWTFRGRPRWPLSFCHSTTFGTHRSVVVSRRPFTPRPKEESDDHDRQLRYSGERRQCCGS